MTKMPACSVHFPNRNYTKQNTTNIAAVMLASPNATIAYPYPVKGHIVHQPWNQPITGLEKNKPLPAHNFEINTNRNGCCRFIFCFLSQMGFRPCDFFFFEERVLVLFIVACLHLLYVLHRYIRFLTDGIFIFHFSCVFFGPFFFCLAFSFCFWAHTFNPFSNY